MRPNPKQGAVQPRMQTVPSQMRAIPRVVQPMKAQRAAAALPNHPAPSLPSAVLPSFATSGRCQKSPSQPDARPSLMLVLRVLTPRCRKSSLSSCRAWDCCCVRRQGRRKHRPARRRFRTAPRGTRHLAKWGGGQPAGLVAHRRTCRWCCDRSVRNRHRKSALRNGAMKRAAMDRAGTSPMLRLARSAHHGGQAPAKAGNRCPASRHYGW